VLLRDAQHATLESWMIQSFRHKGLRRFFETGSTTGIQSAHARRLQMILAALDTAAAIEDMSPRRFRLHALKGSSRNRNGNWRVTFKFHECHAFVLDYEDYH
jgi:toxin HigB-1